jgi:hypothetical protein
MDARCNTSPLMALLEIDEGKAAALTTLADTKPVNGATTAQPAKAPPGRMLGTRQRVSGAMWLDAQAQQLSRLDLDLAAQTALLSNTVGKTGKPGTWWFDFTGKLRMQLSHVSGGAAGTTALTQPKMLARQMPPAPRRLRQLQRHLKLRNKLRARCHNMVASRSCTWGSR